MRIGLSCPPPSPVFSCSSKRVSPFVVFSAQMAVVSERLSSALGLGEEDGSFEESQVQVNIFSPELEPQDQQVSAGCRQSSFPAPGLAR